jgi:hypothetical protein
MMGQWELGRQADVDEELYCLFWEVETIRNMK